MDTGVVIVGSGFGCHTHLRAIRGAGLTAAALVGRDPERTRVRAERFEIPLATTSLQEALEAPGVVAVAIATPPLTHHDLVLEAVAAGKHVVCEKPFARDVGEAQEMLDAAEAAGVVHFLGTEFRFGTAQALSNRLIADGAIGEPRIATFLMLMPLMADPTSEVPDWWASAEEGGGWLGAHASHVVDNVRNTFGEFEGVEREPLDHVRSRHDRRRRLQHHVPHPVGSGRDHAELRGHLGPAGDPPSLLGDEGHAVVRG